MCMHLSYYEVRAGNYRNLDHVREILGSLISFIFLQYYIAMLLSLPCVSRVGVASRSRPTWEPSPGSTLQRYIMYRKLGEKYSQKGNCAASVPISTFIYLRAIYDLYIPTIGLPIWLHQNRWTDPGNIEIFHRGMNMEIGNKAAQFEF